MNNKKEEWEIEFEDLISRLTFDNNGLVSGGNLLFYGKQFIRQQREQARREGYMEAVEAIPDNLEYYREIATLGKLKNDWDMTKLKTDLKAKLNNESK